MLFVSFSPISGMEVQLLENAGGQDSRYLPDAFVDTDVVMSAALEAGGAVFLEAKIPFRLRNGGDVSLRIFDAAGRQVAVLAESPLSPGEHAVRWNADSLPSGIYFYRLTSAGRTQARPMLLVK